VTTKAVSDDALLEIGQETLSSAARR
jgi:hypothetical protein